MSAGVCEGVKPQWAEIVDFLVTPPFHVNIDHVAAKPLAQATATVEYREPRRSR